MLGLLQECKVHSILGKPKMKKVTIISVDTKMEFDKIQYSFIYKRLNRIGINGYF